MILLLHITVALISVLFSTIVAFAPTIQRMKISYLLSFITLMSGGVLLVSNPAAAMRTCFAGVVYLGFISITSLKAHYTLARKYA